ncbi:MAG: endonuclease/exonuclease/phosphatase family protein [Treponema sp.]|nr:endonuclease/exonuclease/phosphatase family protein [Treponema sp.]
MKKHKLCLFLCAAGVFLYGLLFMVSACITGCAAAVPENGSNSKDRFINLMTWNIHNLFDGEDNGFEYDEFLESAGWSTEKYRGRVNAFCAAVGSIGVMPDIIMLEEIESIMIFQDIALSLNKGHEWSHFAINPGAALGVGILSRFPLEARAHSVTVDADTAPRPVLEVRLRLDGEDIIVFVCHWKSKLGGDDVTERTRRASARVIMRRIRELRETEPNTGVITAGDLNENHDEFYRRSGTIICALLPDDPYCAQLTGCITNDGEFPFMQKDFIILGGNKPPEPLHFPQESVVLFSPWQDELENGSYYYRNDWETIDHFLISAQFFDNKGWEYEKTAVINFPPFANANGVPFSYNARTGLGLSDHFPLMMTLKMTSD